MKTTERKKPTTVKPGITTIKLRVGERIHIQTVNGGNVSTFKVINNPCGLTLKMEGPNIIKKKINI